MEDLYMRDIYRQVGYIMDEKEPNVANETKQIV